MIRRNILLAVSIWVSCICTAQWKVEAVRGVNSPYPPAIALNGMHQMDMIHFATGTGSSAGQDIWMSWRDGPSGEPSDPVAIGNVGFTSSASMISNAQHKLDLFYRGSNEQLWTSWHDGSWWSAPADLGGVKLLSPPVAVKDGAHKIDVFYLGPNKHIWTSYWDGGQWWSEAADLGGEEINSTLTAVTTGPHIIDIFYVINNRLWTSYYDGTWWSAPTNLGNVVTSNVSGISIPATATDVKKAVIFYRNNINKLVRYVSRDGSSFYAEDTGVGVGSMLAGATLNEVYFMGTQQSTQSPSGGLYRAYR